MKKLEELRMITPIKSEDGQKIYIWYDIYTDIDRHAKKLTAIPLQFRTAQLYEVDKPDDPKKGAVVSLSAKEAKVFAELILELLEGRDEKADSEAD